MLDQVARVKRISNKVSIIAGNIATAEGAQALIDAGADAIKIGIGPGSICTTRIYVVFYLVPGNEHPGSSMCCRSWPGAIAAGWITP